MRDRFGQWAGENPYDGQNPYNGGPGRITAPGGEDAAGPVQVLGPLWREEAAVPYLDPYRTPALRQPDEPRGAAGPYGHGPGGRPARRRGRHRPLLRVFSTLLVALLTAGIGTCAWAYTALNREVDLGAYGHRPPPGQGTTYLIVGSDSREGLSAGDVADLHAGGGGGRRTDSMILLHTGAAGTTMVSLPRDSWVTVPAHTVPATGKHAPAEKDKLNATFSRGGPELLIRTIEYNTRLRIDHYAEIGFAGFVNVVNAVGGVRMCLRRDIRDEKSGADLSQGCQTLDGEDALAFVRQRHQEADGDLGRTRNQQRFLSALAGQAATPGTVLDPSELYPTLRAGLDTLVVDRHMGLRDLASMVRAVQDVAGGGGRRINVPVSGVGVPSDKGSAVTWDRAKTDRLFDRLRHDRPIDPSCGHGSGRGKCPQRAQKRSISDNSENLEGTEEELR